MASIVSLNLTDFNGARTLRAQARASMGVNEMARWYAHECGKRWHELSREQKDAYLDHCRLALLQYARGAHDDELKKILLGEVNS